MLTILRTGRGIKFSPRLSFSPFNSLPEFLPFLVEPTATTAGISTADTATVSTPTAADHSSTASVPNATATSDARLQRRLPHPRAERGRAEERPHPSDGQDQQPGRRRVRQRRQQRLLQQQRGQDGHLNVPQVRPPLHLQGGVSGSQVTL